ncbi:MAG: hypothetical protein WCK98_00335 [bacterium]
MKIWKFILLGISGDLAKLKILPGLAQFAALNQERVSIELTGYSRSKPDINQINQILNQASPDLKHSLAKVELMQGAYDDAKFFENIYSNLDPDQEAVIYLAVPPNVFLDFITSCCPYNKSNIHLIVEKPFGSSPEEAQAILKVLTECHLEEKVHFSDHYLFKTETNLSGPEKLNLKGFRDNLVDHISIKVLEDIGVENRVGYYDQTGVIKDILPHILSLNIKLLELLWDDFESSELEKLTVKKLVTGQYETYDLIPDLEFSKTETYFQTELELKHRKLKVIYESGKRMASKLTQLEVYFKNGSKVVWNIHPNKVLEMISDDKNVSINLNKNSKLDHTNLFEAILNQDFSRFVKPHEIKLGWDIWQKISDFKTKKKVSLVKYQNLTYPPKVGD